MSHFPLTFQKLITTSGKKDLLESFLPITVRIDLITMYYHFLSAHPTIRQEEANSHKKEASAGLHLRRR